MEKIKCGTAQSSIVINNENSNVNQNTAVVGMHAQLHAKNKWAALVLCILLGYFGAYKIYEGKAESVLCLTAGVKLLDLQKRQIATCDLPFNIAVRLSGKVIIR